MTAANEEQARAARTYNSASDSYDDPANSFWERFGGETVDRLALQKGMRILDVCCGSGASALAAAAVVGPSGYVLGLDLAEDLLRLGRNKAANRGLSQVEFRVGDMLNPGIAENDFDAVICVFGIFFVSDMTAAASQLWQRVRTGGQLAVTTWGPRFFEPLNSLFWDSVRDVRPDLYKGFQPWDRIAEPEALEALLSAAGVTNPKAILEPGTHVLRAPEDWWTTVLGSGYRATIDQLDADAKTQVQSRCLEFIRTTDTRSIEANVIFGRAVK